MQVRGRVPTGNRPLCHVRAGQVREHRGPTAPAPCFRLLHNEEGDGVTLTRDEAVTLRTALDKALAADELERS